MLVHYTTRDQGNSPYCSKLATQLTKPQAASNSYLPCGIFNGLHQTLVPTHDVNKNDLNNQTNFKGLDAMHPATLIELTF